MSVVAKILEQRTFNVPGKLKITEYFFGGIPRDWSKPEAGQLRIFARGVRKAEKPAEPVSEDDEKKSQQLPWVVFFQGGPGFECGPPQHNPITQTILDRGYQMLYLDQRGTGLSSPVSASVLGLRGDDKVQADYLKSFRADSIVKDAEAIRKALTANYPQEKQKWSIMGQSFGGFCCTSYLSMYPNSVREAFIFGGLPPLSKTPDPIYEGTYKMVIRRNEAYYAKFPEDVERVKQIVYWLDKHTIRLPSGGVLTARRFQQLGFNLGFHGGVDSVHNIVLRANNELSLVGHLTRQTLSIIESMLPFDDHIIYSMLHEPCYSRGPNSAPNWSAHRIRAKYPQFDASSDSPVYFTGEMIYPWMFDDYVELRKLKDQAEILAQTSDWSELYDEEQLAKNEVPVYAAVYMDDMYVDYDLSMETAKKIRGCKTHQVNNMYHDAVRSKMDEVTKALFALRDDVID